jgi:DNA-binding SARP family transcriptional activator
VSGRPGASATQTMVRVLNGFSVCVEGVPLHLSMSEARLIAFLILHNGVRSRAFVAGHLWPELDEARARANLRSTLWRLRGHAPDSVDGAGDQLVLSESVDADIWTLCDLTRPLIDGGAKRALPSALELGVDLLPGWYDDWVIFERERLRQLTLHALERLAAEMLSRSDFGAALNASLTAIRIDPLRESAHRMVVRIHLAENNLAEARRQYETCRELLAREVGVVPSAALTSMLATGRDAAIPVEERTAPPAAENGRRVRDQMISRLC